MFSNRRISPRLAVMVGIFLVLSSMALFAGSVFTYFHARNFARTASKADGTVIKLVEENAHDHNNPNAVDYFPVFRFTDAQGNGHEVQSSAGSYPASYKIGDQVPLLYSPGDPTNVVTDTFWGVWIWPVALLGAGVFDLVFAVLFVFVALFLQGRA